ncbi:MAG: ABC transporter permease, partial [Nitriliruptoraceae bacterium]
MTAFVIARVEVRRFLRDRSNLFFVFGFPILLVIFIGSQFSGQAAIQLGVIAPDEARAALAVDALRASDNVMVIDYRDVDGLIDDVARSRISGGVVIEPGFATTGQPPWAITVLAPPGTTATTIETLVSAAIAPLGNRIGAAQVAGEILDVAADESTTLDRLAMQVAEGLASVTVEVHTAGGDPLAQEFAALGQF